MEPKDYFTFIASGLALFFSGYSIYRTSKNARRQIIVSKLEEAYEAISTLNYYYHSFLVLTLNLENSISTEIFDAKQRGENRIAYDKQVARYKEHVNLEDLNHKCNRLEIIANAYISGQLKIRILAFNKFFVDLISISLGGQWLTRDMFYKKGFPDHDILNKTTENILSELIELIQLGGKAIKQKDIRKYIESTLKPELGI